MSLSAFIHGHHREIIDEFAAFARTLMPVDSHMTESELRDHAEEMLTAIVQDMETDQTLAEQARKSKSLGAAQAMAASGRLHADARIEHGFGPGHVLAEFRALRASVLRLYEQEGPGDLAGVRRFNEAIDEALAESMARYAAKTDLYRDQLIGILSHDLRTPLGAIMVGAALLAMTTKEDQRQPRAASRILVSAQRMERMIADLLDLTRTRLGGAIPLKCAPTDLSLVCQEVFLEVQSGRPGAVVHFDCSGDVSGHWDADRLAQVVSNLVGNALQHGDGTPVTVVARDERDTVVLTVQNNGRPIPADARRSIFEPLRQGQDGANGGIGLGLFIAKASVTAHGGDIDVSSSDSTAGTTFRVALPRTARPRSPASAASST
jgi:hypothetical protein